MPSTSVATFGSVIDIVYDGNEILSVVGESYRQDALWRLVGGLRQSEVREECVAQLVPEPTNQYDGNAIAVFVRGERVGYLSRDDAVKYGPGLRRLISQSPSGQVLLHGWICGGGYREDGLGRLGVFLDHDPEDFGITQQEPPHATFVDLPQGYGFRTGQSSAQATDLEDDSYDLSWLANLSPNVANAIGQLRTLLDEVDDPIDRHYMYAELEHRLYSCKVTFSSALDEYDEACRRHDEAMGEIRPALFAKFGRMPFLETYKQAAIRCQQAKDWAGVKRWAERGLSLYGDDAAKPEFADDLRRRLARATAKLEAASRPPRPRAPRPPRAPASTEPAIETLTCQQCGASFDRLRTRGRKPHACPRCREDAAKPT